MYIKLINLVKSGEKIYNNTGSCAQVTNYLVQEKERVGEKVEFFNNNKNNLTKEEANSIIDTNIKGLKAEDDKFINIAINPSDQELKHIGNDQEKLKEYTQEVMRLYAENFEIKNKISVDNLVWVATIHNERHYKHTDIYYSAEEQNKENIPKGSTKPGMENIRVGDLKPGFNTHIHVIVSCRDKEMKTTLNPLKAKQSRFSIYNLSAQSNKQFAEKYNNPKTIKNYTASINKQYNKMALTKFDQVSKRVEFYLSKNEFKDYLKDCPSKKAVYEALRSMSFDISSKKDIPSVFVFRHLREKVKEFEKKDILLSIPDKLEKEIKIKEDTVPFNLSEDFSMLSGTKDNNQDADYVPVKKRRSKKGKKR